MGSEDPICILKMKLPKVEGKPDEVASQEGYLERSVCFYFSDDLILITFSCIAYVTLYETRMENIL